MTALQDYSITARNGSENQSALYLPKLTEEENELVSRLPGVLEELDALFVPPDDDEVSSYYGFFTDSTAFLACLFKHWRFLWRAFGVLEDHPSLDYESFIPDYQRLGIRSIMDGLDDDPPFLCTTLYTFRFFMYSGVSPFSITYRRYLLTGEVFLDPVEDAYLF